ncbi:Uncharacterised protein [Escherichia coli]|uniref:Uncharacterized protein n=1 Tax=Escherichia coli TaxID=562 RepID=A0A376MMW8_ECOLX|nr:Uncharacterised protein [Escherichia coli]
MLAFLNQVRKPTLDLSARSAAQNVVQTVHAILPGGLYRLPDDVPDSQEL